MYNILTHKINLYMYTIYNNIDIREYTLYMCNIVQYYK